MPGAVASVVGLCLAPLAGVLFLAWLYFQFKEVAAVEGVLHGASAAAVALTLTMDIKTGQKCLTGVIPVGLFALAFVLNGILRWPLFGVLGVVAPLALIWTWPRKSAQQSA